MSLGTALALTAVAAAGCGSSAKTSSGGAGGTATPPPTPARYKAAVVSECRSIAADTALQTQAKAVSKQSGSAVAKFAKLLKLTTPEYRSFYAITPPAGDVAATAFHRDLKSLITVSGALQRGVAANRTTAALATTVTSLETSLDHVVADFKAFGIRCGTT